MKKLLPKLRNFIFPTLIILVTLILAFKNYQPGTFLSGWDTLHPEFNLSLYLKRAFFGVWQEHQGVGAVASQAHAAELPRLLIVWMMSFILPVNLVRYSFFFLTLGAGGVGTYFLSKYLLSIHSERFSREAAFLAGVFSILNLATLQQYYVPLEMFAVHFATLPWLLLLAISYLREGKSKLLVGFSIVTLFSASMAHTPTLFYAYLGAFILFIVSAFIFVRRVALVKRGGVLIGLTLLLNVYWLAPNVYFLVNHASDVTNSKINRVFSDEAFLQSQAYGDFQNLGKLKNFLFNWREYNFSQGKFVDLMDEWVGYGYSLMLIVIFGFLIAAIKKQKYALAFLPVLLVCAFFIANSSAPFAPVFDFLRSKFNLFREGLRFPFTKFSILLVASMSVFLAFTFQFIMQFLGKIKLGFLFLAFSFSLLVYSMLPAFKGNFISPSMKVAIPQEYFQMFDWFKKQDVNARVAKLPLNTFWGWNFYSWGYQGAGFTWFGIPQPTFDREFDRWSPYNEDFYSEASFALYDKDLASFEKVLTKYQVRYLLLDESIINAGGTDKTLFIPEIKSMLTSSKHIKLEEQFGFLSVYAVSFDESTSASSLIYSDVVYDPRIKSDKLPLNIKLLVKEDLTKNRGFAQAVNCDLIKAGSVEKIITDEGILYKASGGGVSCDFLNYPNLKYSEGYILRVTGQNLKGRSLKIYLNNVVTGRMDLEELLPKGKFDEHFVILPKKLQGGGYVLSFETRSYGKVAAENILENVEIYTLDNGLVTNLNGNNQELISDNLIVNVPNKLANYLYFLDAENDSLIVLPQGFEEGWIAYNLDEKRILPHAIFNSWANEWTNEKPGKVVIIFWPQLMELAGVFIGLATLLTVFAYHAHRCKSSKKSSRTLGESS